MNDTECFQGWLNHCSPQEADILQGLFDKVFEDLYVFAKQNLTAKMVVLECMQIKQVKCGSCNDGQIGDNNFSKH